MDVIGKIEIRLPSAFSGSLLGVFGHGVLFPCGAGETVQSVLQNRLRLDAGYIEQRIRTVFVNGSPVDELEQAVLGDGDELALAGALPGLVGICMGRCSPVAGFRQGITYAAGEEERSAGLIRLKLFNTVAVEIGRRVLEQGVLLDLQKILRMLSTIGSDRRLSDTPQGSDWECVCFDDKSDEVVSVQEAAKRLEDLPATKDQGMWVVVRSVM